MKYNVIIMHSKSFEILKWISDLTWNEVIWQQKQLSPNTELSWIPQEETA